MCEIYLEIWLSARQINTIMSILQEYFKNACIPCIHYLVNKKLHWTERIFWLFAILASIGGTYYVVTRTLYEYRIQKPMFKADTNYLDWNSLYPSVVICETAHSNILTKQKRAMERYYDAMKFNKSVIADVDLSLKIFELAFFLTSNANSITTICSTRCPTANFSILTNELQTKCDYIFSYCTFNSKVFNCCDEFLPVKTPYGTCYGFNNYGSRYEDGSPVQSLKWYILREPGTPHGTLHLETQIPYVTIHVVDPRDIPHYANPNSKTKDIKPDRLYYFRLNIEETVTFDEEESVSIEDRLCRFPSENYLKYFSFYSHANCMAECHMLTQKKICGCILHMFPVDASEHCDLENLKCASKVPVDSNCDCLPNCNSTTFYKVGNYDRKIVEGFYNRNKTTKVSFTLDVPAPTLRYIRNSLKTPLSLIVSIGGALGFFMGISYLSIAQFFYYFCVRPVSDHIMMKRKQKAKDKEDKMDENFRVARMKLKLNKVERDIQQGMKEKLESFTPSETNS